MPSFSSRRRKSGEAINLALFLVIDDSSVDRRYDELVGVLT